MGEKRYNEIKITVEDIASILYGVEVGKRAKDGSIVVLKLVEKQIDEVLHNVDGCGCKDNRQ